MVCWLTAFPPRCLWRARKLHWNGCSGRIASWSSSTPKAISTTPLLWRGIYSQTVKMLAAISLPPMKEERNREESDLQNQPDGPFVRIGDGVFLPGKHGDDSGNAAGDPAGPFQPGDDVLPVFPGKRGGLHHGGDEVAVCSAHPGVCRGAAELVRRNFVGDGDSPGRLADQTHPALYHAQRAGSGLSQCRAANLGPLFDKCFPLLLYTRFDSLRLGGGDAD